MAKNDKVLIDGIIDEIVKCEMPSVDRGTAFERFSVEQILKDYDLDFEELQSGSVDGSNDGGIDYVFFFVNGNLVSNVSNFKSSRMNSHLEAYFISCKHADSFKLSPIDSMLSTFENY